MLETILSSLKIFVATLARRLSADFDGVFFFFTFVAPSCFPPKLHFFFSLFQVYLEANVEVENQLQAELQCSSVA